VVEVKRFLIKVDTGFVGGTHEDEVEFDDETWEGWTEGERTEALEGCVQDLISNQIEGYWEEIQ
jgi:hypothetical protein